MGTDPDKIKVMAELPTHTNNKQLQRFLGFANFCWRFVRNYSIIASPLTKLTSVKTFLWTPEADLAFQQLKDKFTSAVILIQPNPDQQFILEMDASLSGVGAVLSQRSQSEGKLHRYTFFSQKLSIAEQNNDVGNRNF